jgi:hypothetical protein
MGYAQENGYIAASIETIMLSVMNNINTQFGTSYTWETFVGTNFYKYFYAIAQRIQENETKTAEIFSKLQDYFAITNEEISRPVVTPQGLIDALAVGGYIASVKPPADADAGKIYICVDVDDTDEDYAATKLAINTLISQSTIAGCVTQGTESSSITLSNGQSFDFKYALPDRTEVLLKLTTTLSENNRVVIGDPDSTKQKLMDNIAERYQLGLNFEPQRYFSLLDAPWASDVLLEYSIDDGENWLTEVFDSEYDELFDVLLENITLVEA